MTQDKGNDKQWKGKKDRDDTPSFIRNVSARSNILNPGRTSSSYLPVLAVPASVKIWQKIRWPLAVTTIIVILSTVGFFTNDILVSRNVEQRIKDSFIGEETAHVQVLLESNRVLQTMANKYSARTNVQAAFAWNCVLITQLFGDSEGFVAKAEPAFEAIRNDTSSIGYAARATKHIIDGNLQKANTTLSQGLKSYTNEPRLHFVAAWLELARGNKKEGIHQLKEIRKKFPEYLPPLYTLIDVSIGSGDHLAIASNSADLMTASTGNLYGALTALIIRLPRWNSEPLAKGELKNIEKICKDLKQSAQKSPEKLQIYARFIEGRIAAELEDHTKAASIFKELLKDTYNLNVLAWYGQAVMHQKGPSAALEAISKAGENPGFEINDLKARCYLALYKMKQAQAAIAALDGNVDYDLSELKWLLAVGQGNLEAVKSRLPSRITRRTQSAALEMYELLRRVGDKEGIRSLTTAMNKGGLTKCAEAIENWHNYRLVKVYSQFRNAQDSCVAAVALHLMRDNFSPDKLKELSTHLERQSMHIHLKIDLALLKWKTDGYKQGLDALNAIAANQYESDPITVALADAYFRMEQYEKIIELTKNSTYPEAIAFHVRALSGLKKVAQASNLLNKALAKQANANHPALVYLFLAQKVEAGIISEVAENVDAIISTAGIWYSELASLKAQSMSAMGERGDADRYMTAMIKTAAKNIGLDESWDVQKSIIRINLRRGGNFLFKAVAFTLDLYKSRVDDAEVIFSYGIESQRQGNERGAVRYFNEAIALDPTFSPAYKQLHAANELTEEQLSAFKKFRPNQSL